MKTLALVWLLAFASIRGFAEVTPPAAETTQDVAATQSDPDSKPARDEKTPVVQETIVVTATRSPRALSDLPLSSMVVREEEIRTSPALTVDDLLRTLPGLHMPLGSSLGTSSTSTGFSMHGLGGNRALVLLDGLPIHDPYFGTVEWPIVPLESIRQVEVVRGGNASLFGNYALGGTVNLITKPVDTNEIGFVASRGSFATNRASLTIDQTAGDRVGLRLSHNLLRSDGFYNAVSPGPVDVTVWNDNAVTSLRTDLHPSDRTTGFVKTDRAKTAMSLGTEPSRVDRSVLDISAGVHRAAGDRGLLSATIFRRHEDIHLVTTSVAGGVRAFIANDSAIPTDSIGASVGWSQERSGPIAFVSAGLDIRQTEADETRKVFNSSGVMTQQDLVRGRQQFAGLFAQASWRPNARLEILGSVRLDDYRNSEGSDVIVNGAAAIFPATTTTQVDPRASFRYGLGQSSAVRGAAYRAFKAPTLRELYRNSQIGTTTILANPHLTPETLVGAELGYEWASPRAHLEINLYRSDVEGLQVRARVPGQPPNVFQFFNLGKSRSQGVETMADLQLSRRWNVRAGYTYADSTIVSSPADPTLVGKRLPEVAPHIGTLSIRYRGPDGLTFVLRGRTLSRSYGEPANVRPAPAHQVLDVSVSRPVNAWLELYALAGNALDERYYYVLTATSTRATEPRNLTFGARIHMPAGQVWGGD